MYNESMDGKHNRIIMVDKVVFQKFTHIPLTPNKF